MLLKIIKLKQFYLSGKLLNLNQLKFEVLGFEFLKKKDFIAVVITFRTSPNFINHSK